jgi:alpha-tubulin suppressor-like RCC1 family protein
VRDQAGTGYLSGVVAVAAGASHSLALKSDGTLWAFGSNQYGQIAQPSGVTQKTTPYQVTGFPAGTVIVAIAAGDYHSLALAENGKVYGFGLNSYGRLGTGNTTNAFSPVQMLVPAGARVIAAGGQHSLVGLRDGTSTPAGRTSPGSGSM